MSPGEVRTAFQAFIRFIECGGYAGAGWFELIRDEELAFGTAATEFILLPPAAREDIRLAARPAGLSYALWVFALRSAAFALHDGQERHLKAARCALVVDDNVAELREIISALVVIHDAACRLQFDPSLAVFREVLRAATPVRRAIVEGFYCDGAYDDKALKTYGVELATIAGRRWYRLGLGMN
jgi:hypothetical protein